MKHNKLIFNLTRSLWLFALSFLISIVGLQAQNATWSLPPYYLDVIPNVIVSLPTQTGSSGIFPNYTGGAADYTHAAMQDINGDILFFMVDGIIYDKDGYGMGELDGSHLYALGNFKGITEIIIVPVPENCEQYYIVGVFADNNPLNAGTTFKPFYAILDLSVPNTSSGRLGTLVNHSGSELLTANLYDLTSGISPSWGGPKFKNCFIAASKLRTDNTRLLFASNGGRVWRYEISSTGIAFDNYSFSINGDPDAVDMRSEMELYEFSNGNYRIAVPHASGNPNTRVFISDLDNNGDLIPSTDHVLDFPSISGNHAYIKGMEFSPNGRYLYLTHITNSLTFTSFPFKIYDVNTSSYVTPVHSGLINDIPNFQHSTIELASDGKLYFANGSNLATIDNADNPLSLTWNNSQVSLSSYNYNSLGGSYPLSYSGSLYVIPDQVDDMDYTAHFTATPECCIIYTSFDVEADKNNQEYTGTATWSPGATNNPFGSVSGTVTVRDLLVIKSGANITINNMRFEFDVNARLIVENGARLTINNTTLTVYTDCGGTGLMWQGVEVWGQPGFQPQVSGWFTVQNNSLIEHALEGAVNFRRPIPLTAGGSTPNTFGFNGGIIRATNSTFRNNVQDAFFQTYSSILSGNVINDRSFFINTTFITDASLNNASFNNNITHVNLKGVTGIVFSGCDFKNTDVLGTTYSYLGRGTGILSFNTKFTVKERCLNPLSNPCTNMDESKFTNLTSGIRATNSNALTTVQIVNSIFDNNWRGVYLAGMGLPNVSDNNFDVGMMSAFPPSSITASYGLYLDNCTGYKVENNDFTTTHFGFLGAYVNNSGTAANEVYKNTFSKFFVASQAAQINGDGLDNGVGLEFRCNEYEEISDYDILVSSGLVKDDQGLCATILSPVNNQFSYTATGDFWATPNSVGTPTYRYSPGGFNLMPRNGFFNIQNTAEQECFNLASFNPLTSCPKRIQRTRAQLTAALGGLKLSIDSLTGLIDAGSTAALLTIIATQSGGNVNNALLAASPYLSDDVLLAFLATNPSNGHIQQILLANSPLSDVVITYLAGMAVPKGIKNQITNAQTGESAMKLLQQEISFYQSELQRTENDLIRDLLFDEVTNDGFALVEDYLMQQLTKTNEQEQLLALVRIANQDSVAARQQLDALDVNPVNVDFCKLHNVVVDVMPTAECMLALVTDTARATLVGEVADATTNQQEVANAQALLENVGIRNPYNEVIEIVAPQTGNNLRLGSSNNETNVTSTKENRITLYPNPANGQITIAHNLETKNGNVSIQIMDVMGRVLMNKTINNSNNNIEINSISSGLYFFTVSQNGNVVESGKLVVE